MFSVILAMAFTEKDRIMIIIRSTKEDFMVVG
jgi:hypothetical protein